MPWGTDSRRCALARWRCRKTVCGISSENLLDFPQGVIAPLHDLQFNRSMMSWWNMNGINMDWIRGWSGSTNGQCRPDGIWGSTYHWAMHQQGYSWNQFSSEKDDQRYSWKAGWGRGLQQPRTHLGVGTATWLVDQHQLTRMADDWLATGAWVAFQWWHWMECSMFIHSGGCAMVFLQWYLCSVAYLHMYSIPCLVDTHVLSKYGEG